MKKIKLLLAAMAAMVSLGANAQDWTAPTIQGEDPVSGTTYKLYNVGAGKYLAEGKTWFAWSTTAILADNGAQFTLNGNASSFTLTTHRSGNNKVFTSGNGIPGDAMHVDGANANNYGYTKLASGYYHIHDAGGDESSLCWGYGTPNGQTVAGVVAHADANSADWKCDWAFISDASVSLYDARVQLYNLLNTAKEEGIDTDAAGTIYNNESATLDEINAACDALKLARVEKVINTNPEASKDNPVDITNLVLVNPDFEVATNNGQMPPGWTITITGQNCGQMNRTDTNPETGLAITNFIEAWHPSQLGSGVIAQTVNSLPEGTYVLECDASICHDPAGADDITGASLFIQSSLKTERQAISNVRLYINHYSLSFSHGGVGSVTFGLEASNTNANWLSADNFKIFYAGSIDLSIYVEALEDAVAEFEALEAVSDAADYATYKAIVDENNKTYSKSSDYQDAINAIHKATEDLTALNNARKALADAVAAFDAIDKDEVPAALYQEQKAIVDANNKIWTTPTEYNEAAAAVQEATAPITAYLTAKANLAAAVAAANAVAESIPAPVYAALTAVVSDNNKSYDTTAEYETATKNINDALAAANVFVAPYAAFAKAINDAIFVGVAEATITAQSNAVAAATTVDEINAAIAVIKAAINVFAVKDITESTITNPTPVANNAMAEGWEGDNFGTASNGVSEYWGWNAGGQNFHQTLTNLPAGRYRLTVVALQRTNMKGYVYADDTKVNIAEVGSGIVNDRAQASTWFSDGNGVNEVYFALEEAKDVVIGLQQDATLNDHWTVWQSFKLEAFNDVAYDEAASNTINDDVSANVTVNRTVKEGFNTVVLPFDLTAAQVEEAFGEGAAVYAFSENSEDAKAATVNFNKVEEGTISANVPVLVKATAASTSKVFGGVEVKAAESATVEGKNFDFVGVYAPATIANKSYFIRNDAIYKSTGNTNIKAFRAYIENKNPDITGDSQVKMFIDGIATRIGEVNGIAAENGDIYNVAGQRVNKAQKGIFIVNGKKVVK